MCFRLKKKLLQGVARILRASALYAAVVVAKSFRVISGPVRKYAATIAEGGRAKPLVGSLERDFLTRNIRSFA